MDKTGLKKAMNFNRAGRVMQDLKPHIEIINKNCSLSIREEVIQMLVRLAAIKKRVRLFHILQALCGILLYVSFVSAMVGDFKFIEGIVYLISFISGVIGSAVLIAAIFFLNKLINIQITDAQVIASYIIAVSVKYRK
jgi:hypothetical protein